MNYIQRMLRAARIALTTREVAVSNPVAATPAGWYPLGSELRWWTGTEWSEATLPLTSAPPVAPQVIVAGRQKAPVNHALHLILSVLTLGLWLPVWLIIAIAA